MAHAWTQYWARKGDVETEEECLERCILACEAVKVQAEGQSSLGAFQRLPVDVIAIILSHALPPSRGARLPTCARTCKLFFVLMAEGVERACNDGICRRLHLLACARRLRHLQLFNTHDSTNDALLAAVLRRVPCLESISAIDEHSFPQMMAALSSCPRLSTVDTRAPKPATVAAYAALQTLHTLHIEGCSFTPEPLTSEAAASALTPCKSLRRFHWEVCSGADPSPLLTLTQLTSLEMHVYSDADPLTPSDSAAHIQIPGNLRELIVIGNDARPMHRLWRAVRTSQLRHLWLLLTPPPDVLLDMRHLSKLSVELQPTNDAAADAAATALVGCLPKLRQLTALNLVRWEADPCDLGYDELRDTAEHFEIMLRALPDCAALRSLSVTGSIMLSRERAGFMCAAMEKWQWETLDIRGSGCGDDVVRDMVESCAARRGVTLLTGWIPRTRNLPCWGLQAATAEGV